jgi:hypothetical protein
MGHVLFGITNGLKFLFTSVGPITILKKDKRIKLKENKSWYYFQGVTALMPKVTDQLRLRRSWILYAAGGPVFNIIHSILCLIIYFVFSIEFFKMLAVVHAAIFAVTIIPMKSGPHFSDGAIIYKLLKKDESAEQYLNVILLSREMMSKKRPEYWSQDLIELCRRNFEKHSNENTLNIYESTYRLFLFYYHADRYGMKEAFSYLHPILNKLLKSKDMNRDEIIAFYMLYKFLYENENITLEEMKKLMKQLNRNDFIGYGRSVAIIKYLENNKNEALTALEQSEKRLLNSMNTGIMGNTGIMELEKDWTDLLRHTFIRSNKI